MTFNRLAGDDRKTLIGYLQQALFRILPDGEMARILNQAIPDVIEIAFSDNGCDELELQCYRSPAFRSKLLLLVSVAKHLMIRHELKLLENSLIAGTPSYSPGRQDLLLDIFDKLQTRIVSWKRPISTSFMDSTVDGRTTRSARQDGHDRLSGWLRWQ
ncbi:hypothetical protein HFO97_27235 [Rhizobium leguminosarum]|uniref:hypothetical protein n=1 Tax=Rhizobium leguminosarum TaxID=384 RepID=UPI001C956027|nr:hypothetical protein [Rhizobium leguminosarum]MBY5363577.1 hypothetical protein [Rhizobium leguminosarum]